MEIAKQACSYTQAIELHDLGVKQKSLWYHTNSKEWGILIKSSIDFSGNPHSAFTCAELGEMLPKRIGEETILVMNNKEDEFSFSYIKYHYIVPRTMRLDEIRGNKFRYEAEAKADLLIKLIKEGYIKVEGVNKHIE